jgi:hypothetical protein
MTKTVTILRKLYDQISDDIEAVRASGEVAPDGVNIVPYSVTRNGFIYEYYKLVAPEPIFEGKNGKKTKTKHLGDKHSQQYKEAKLPIDRRKAIKILEAEQAQIYWMRKQPWQFIEDVKRSRKLEK